MDTPQPDPQRTDDTATTDEPRRVPLEHPDGSTSPLLLVEATAGGTDSDIAASRPGAAPGEPPLAVLVVPGIAVGARYYLPLARALAAGGVDTAVTELRGQGESSYRVARGSGPAGYHESAAQDLPAALDGLERALGPRRVVLLGHSMGAQIGVYHLARRDRRVVGLIGVATQSPYHRGFPAETGRRLRVGAAILPLIGLVTGSVPARFLGGTGAQPTSRMRDWARLVARGTLQPARADIDYPAALREVTVPILLVAIAGDEQAPESAGRELLRLVPSAPGRIDLETTELGHNRWARTPEPVVRRVLAWLDEQYRG